MSDELIPRAAESDGASDALRYLLAEESGDYIAVMDVLEASITDLTPREVTAAVAGAGRRLPDDVVETRLEKLRSWGAAHASTDERQIRRHSDLLARNWRYTVTPAGRKVQRFFRDVLSGTVAVREIPVAGLNRIVRGLQALRDLPSELISEPAVGDYGEVPEVIEQIGRIFLSLDDLDDALVGAEDSLADLVDRFDLDDESASELKGLLVDYATRVAVELEDGSALAHHLASQLRSRFEEFAAAVVAISQARALIELGAVVASKGGGVDDWDGLVAWLDPQTGRAARFSMRLVRALPGMHANLRRLHTSAGAATSRARALLMARACLHPEHGTAIALAVLGDHSWRKLYHAADDLELVRVPSWRAGPRVDVPDLLRLTGRGGARGRAPAARDDREARAVVSDARARRAAEHAEAIREVLEASSDTVLSSRAASVALASLMAAARRGALNGVRSATTDGLACTLARVDGEGSTLLAPAWKVCTPGRVFAFHAPGQQVRLRAERNDRDASALVVVSEVA
jgi:hypothetical protein